MGRKKKFVNKTQYPDYAIERFTRCIFDDVLAFFATEEGQAEYEAWEAEQAQLKLHKTKKRAASTAALSVYWGFFFLGPRGLDSGRISQPLAKYVCS